jgi:hypothetical protein
LQLGEMKIGGDIIVLATPEIGGLPYVISGMVAAGGLAAALSTADGLLLTIANALSHDLYYKMIDPNAPTARRVMISKVLLLVVAVLAALVAAQKPADILFLVSAAFSFAAAAFFPALVLGIFWKRANKWGASLGMIAGLGRITFYYMATQPWLRGVFGVTKPIELWWGIQPISAGVFGVPLGFAVIIVVSLLTYLCLNIECSKETLTELETGFRFNDAVLRHLTVAKAKAETTPSVMMKAVEREEARKERQEDRLRRRPGVGRRRRDEPAGSGQRWWSAVPCATPPPGFRPWT